VVGGTKFEIDPAHLIRLLFAYPPPGDRHVTDFLHGICTKRLTPKTHLTAMKLLSAQLSICKDIQTPFSG